MALSELTFTKDWTIKGENADFPTTETSEDNVRADIQFLHDETKNYINGTLKTFVDNLQDGSGLADGSVTEDKIANRAVTSYKIAEGAIYEGLLADGVVALSKLSAYVQGKVEGAYQKPSGGIPTEDIANGAVTGSKIANGAITFSKIAEGGIIEDCLGTYAVTEDKIKGKAVTTVKLDDKAVTHAKLADGAVQNNNIVDGEVTAAKLAAGVRTSLGKAETAYQKPSGGIPESDLASAVKSKLYDPFVIGVFNVGGTYSADATYAEMIAAAAAGRPFAIDCDDTGETIPAGSYYNSGSSEVQAHITYYDFQGNLTALYVTARNSSVTVYRYSLTPYEKPSGGIPSTDLISAVQTSLGKADSAMQPFDITLTYSGGVYSINKTYAEIIAALHGGKTVRLVYSGNLYVCDVMFDYNGGVDSQADIFAIRVDSDAQVEVIELFAHDNTVEINRTNAPYLTSVNTGNIANGAVSTNKLAANAVTAAKMDLTTVYFDIEVTDDGEDPPTYSADKTYAQITAAVAAGMHCRIVYDGLTYDCTILSDDGESSVTLIAAAAFAEDGTVTEFVVDAASNSVSVSVYNASFSGGGSGPELSNDTPQALGTAAAGTSTKCSRADHVHQKPTATEVGAVPSRYTGLGDMGKILVIDDNLDVTPTSKADAGLLPVYTTLTIATTDWSSQSCTKTVTGMKSTSVVWLEYSDTTTNFTCAQSANALTFTCDATPSAAVTVKVAFMEGVALS